MDCVDEANNAGSTQDSPNNFTVKKLLQAEIEPYQEIKSVFFFNLKDKVGRGREQKANWPAKLLNTLCALRPFVRPKKETLSHDLFVSSWEIVSFFIPTKRQKDILWQYIISF